jgi:hypothetical protein
MEFEVFVRAGVVTAAGARIALNTARTRCRLRQRNASLLDFPSARFLPM